jgi:hypothetical protein
MTNSSPASKILIALLLTGLSLAPVTGYALTPITAGGTGGKQYQPIDKEDSSESQTNQSLQQRRADAKKYCEDQLNNSNQQDQQTGPGTTPGGAGSINAVPVHEVGDLLNTTKNIDKSITEINDKSTEMRDIQILICTELKILHDIELAREERETKGNPDARSAATTALQAQAEEFRGAVATGKTVSPAILGTPGGTGGLFGDPLGIPGAGGIGVGAGGGGSSATKNNGQSLISNPGRNRQEIRTEEAVKHAEQLKNSASPYGQQLAQETQQAASLSAYDTLKPPARLQYQNGKLQENPTDPLGTFLLASRPEGNYQGQKIIAKTILESRTGQREIDAQAEQVSGFGYDSIRECVGGFINGVCRQWQVVTPGSTIAGVMLRLLTAAYDLAINTHTVLEDKVTALFGDSGAKITNLVPTDNNQTSQTETTTQDPCVGAQPCENTGWNQGGGVNSADTVISRSGSGGLPGLSSGTGFDLGLANVFNSLNGLDGNGNSPNNGGGDTGNGPNFEIPSYNVAITLPAPQITDFAVVTKDSGEQHLVWHTNPAFFCGAENEWPGITPAIHKNQILPATGDFVISDPISFEPGYQLICFGFNPTTGPVNALAKTQ